MNSTTTSMKTIFLTEKNSSFIMIDIYRAHDDHLVRVLLPLPAKGQLKIDNFQCTTNMTPMYPPWNSF